jgi:hypothetical protein
MSAWQSKPIAEFYAEHPRPDHGLRFNGLGIADKDLAARVGDILAVEGAMEGAFPTTDNECAVCTAPACANAR